MTIEVLFFEGCPNHRPTLERIHRILHQEGIAAGVAEIAVPNAEAAKDLAFVGSPTVRVNGLDVEPAARDLKNSAFACRRYPDGLPSEELIRAALREARGQR